MQSVFQNGWKINQNSTIEEKTKGKKRRRKNLFFMTFLRGDFFQVFMGDYFRFSGGIISGFQVELFKVFRGEIVLNGIL